MSDVKTQAAAIKTAALRRYRELGISDDVADVCFKTYVAKLAAVYGVPGDTTKVPLPGKPTKKPTSKKPETTDGSQITKPASVKAKALATKLASAIKSKK